jgi:hypothetical protein
LNLAISDFTVNSGFDDLHDRSVPGVWAGHSAGSIAFLRLFVVY